MFAPLDFQTSPPSISSAVASPVKISLLLGRVLGWQARALAYGESTHESLASFDPDLSLWRTSQLCLGGEPQLFSETLPYSGTMRSGRLYAPPTWERPTDANGCSSWPTATCMDATESTRTHEQHDQHEQQKKASNPKLGELQKRLCDVVLWPTVTSADSNGHCQIRGVTTDSPTSGTTLVGAVRMWPTPDSGVFNDGQTAKAWEARHQKESAKGYNGNGGGTPLAMAVRLPQWATPRKEGFDAGKHRGQADSLHSQVKDWATPRASGTTLGGGSCQRKAMKARGADIQGKLNPAWVESLMGLPPGWTDGLPVPAKHSTRGRRREPLEPATTEQPDSKR